MSLAGRATLIQSVSSAIPAYVMQCNSLPASTCETLDRINRNFLWGSTAEKRKLHVVGWNKVTRPKANSGLGIRKTSCLNKALLARMNWRIFKERDKLWARTLTSKY